MFGSVVLVSCGDNSADNTGGTSDTANNSAMGMDTANTGNNSSMATYTSTPLAGADSTFVKEAASGGMMEVELGNMAQQMGASERVKSFGAMMVRDHTQANNELKAIAQAKGLMLPDSMMAKHRQHVDMLRNKNGQAFDQSYMSMMVKDHQEDVNKFTQTASTTNDPDLKAFTNKTVPVLQMHLDSAQAINNNRQ